MYIPKEFEIKDRAKIWEFIGINSFATVISVKDNSPQISHLPLVEKKVGDQYFLEGHISLANCQAQELLGNKAVTVVFKGVHGYISSSVYHHHNVPTWNYQAVHASGTVIALTESDLEKHLEELVEKHEHGRENPLVFSSFSRDMITSYIKEIVGFRIEVNSFQASFKLSQNRDDQDFKAITEDIERCPHTATLSEEMKKSRN